MNRISVVALILALAWPTASAVAAGVELRVDPTAVDVADAPQLVLVNNANVDIRYGVPFKLERWTGARWRWINRHQAWPLPLLFLDPGETSQRLTVGVYGTAGRVLLARGLYRVTKIVDVGTRRVVLRATFRVLARPTGPAES